MVCLFQCMSVLSIMGYFDDIWFAGGSVSPGCRAVVDARFAGTYSVELMLAGKMAYGVDGGEQVILDRPLAFWHHPGHRYQYGAVDARGWDHHWVMMGGARARRLIEAALMPLSPHFYVEVAAPHLLAQEFRELVARLENHEPRRHPEAVARLERIVALIVVCAATGGDGVRRHSGIEALAARVREQPEVGVDFAAEAARLHMSGSHFRRLFCRQIGQAPKEFALSCRMRKAAHALQSPEAQVKSVAAALGYDDAAQFSKLFKKKIGVAPAHYQRAFPR
jgi:AraC-like DNA-binding protein